MTLIAYEKWSPSPKSAAMVEHALDIIGEYSLQGYTLTLRQLYYQFVARDLLPNTERSYKNLGTMVTKARMAGMISWDAIEDRNREHYAFWADMDEMNAIKRLPAYIRADRWAEQDYYVEVWVEKEALGNIVDRACSPFFVPHMACKGYLSASEAWRAGQRFLAAIERGKEPVLIHLGDHDPSGIDMTRDNGDRLAVFTELHGVDVRRIALNMDQVEQYAPPPNPAKVTDSRAKGYIKRFGHTSWELDALEPQVLEALIQDEIRGCVDQALWDKAERAEQEKRAMLRRVADRWEQIQPIVES